MKLLKEVLKDLKPDEKAIKKEVNGFLKSLNSALKRDGISASAVAGGSVAKGTFIRGDHDCDIFVKFSCRKYSDKDISKLLAGVLRKTLRGVRTLHGSRDYFQARNSLNYEIVPVLDIRKPEQAMNVTDFSPLHVRWVNKFPKMKDEIRLTKAFMKAAGVYGAESYMRGFSGHVVDILTIHYGGFLKLLRAAARWKQGHVIDYCNHHKGKALFNLNRSKTQSPIIVIDPIQPERNAAAALGKEKFDIFRKKAKEFLKKPSRIFFEEEKLSIEKLREKAEKGGGKLIIIDAEAKRAKEDVAGAKLLKSLEYIIRNLRHNDFNVKDYGWQWNKKRKALFWIITGSKDLPKTVIREGPPVKAKKHCQSFRKRHKKTFEKKGRLYAEVKRDYTNAEKFIKHLLGDEYFRDKAGKISVR